MPTLTWEEIDALRDGAERYGTASSSVSDRLLALESTVMAMSEQRREYRDAAQMQQQIDQLVENTTRLKQMVIDLTQQRQPDAPDSAAGGAMAKKKPKKGGKC